MTNYESCWKILKALTATFNGYSIDLDQIDAFMSAVEEAVQD